MANLTNTMYLLLDALGKCDIEKARGYGKVFLTQPKYAENGNAQALLKQLDESSVHEVPYELKQFIDVVMPDDIDISLWFARDWEEALVDDIARISLNAGELADKGVRYVNSVLLSGMPGVGKTLFANALAKRLDYPLYKINTSTLISSYLGQTSLNLYKVFNFAKARRAVMLLDEIDAFGLARGAKGEVKEMARVTITLMQMLDALPSGFVLIGTTNRPDTLDAALSRRFERTVEMPPFSRDDAIGLVELRLSKVFPDAFTHKEVDEAFPRGSSFIPSRVSGLLNNALVTRWPDKPDLEKAFEPLALF